MNETKITDIKSNFELLQENTFFKALKLVRNPCWTTETFCHYTNLHGLIGILDKNEIWMSDHRFLNDSSEYSYGEELAIKILNKKINENRENKFSMFLGEVLKKIAVTKSFGIYIASMSLVPDRLDQWKGYGRNAESVCMVFDGGFELWNDGNTSPTHIRQNLVVYDEEEQVKIIESFIDIYEHAYFNGLDEWPFKLHFMQSLVSLVEQQLIFFKHKEYKSEGEVRITIENLVHILEKKQPLHRVVNGMIVPYITTKYISADVNPVMKPLPLKEVIVSPLANQRETIKSIEVFLKNKGYDDVPVNASNIRYRG